MNISKEQLSEIEKCGSRQFTLEETAIIVQIDKTEFVKEMKDKTSDVYISYHRGRLQTEFDIRTSMIDLAARGSSQAQDSFMKLKTSREINEI